MKTLEKIIDEYINNEIVKHIIIRVGKGDRIIYDTARGGVNEETLFDMASVTKIFATTSLALIALDKGLINIEDSVDKFYPTDKKLKIKNLLTHTIGFGNKRLDKICDKPENIADSILGITPDIPIGTDVIYSCPGFILLGKILEKAFAGPLNDCFEELVAKPLHLENTAFLPRFSFVPRF